MIATWQAWLQQIVLLASKGYRYYHLTEYPERKRDRWSRIDAKLIAKYQANRPAWEVYRKKKRGLANFKVVRWEQWCVILQSPGRFPDLEDPDRFQDMQAVPLLLQISERVAVKVQVVPQGVDVRLSRDTYRNIKAELAELCVRKQVSTLLQSFHKLNGFPAYRGINEQRKQLREFVIREAKRHQLPLDRSSLPLRTRRKVYRVYDA
ncbi:hypothetical protein D6833_10305 [Candidatus Parcubacteria bacterium]|nr:MAG: hypothetical protein D6833_10305 [Candidatus Parcubacteria bacterium]